MLSRKIEANEAIPTVPHKKVYFIDIFVKDMTNPAPSEIKPRITDAPANRESCQPNFISTAKERIKANISVNTDTKVKTVQQKVLCHLSSAFFFWGRSNPITITARRRTAKTAPPNFKTADCQGGNEKPLRGWSIIRSLYFLFTFSTKDEELCQVDMKSKKGFVDKNVSIAYLQD